MDSMIFGGKQKHSRQEKAHYLYLFDNCGGRTLCSTENHIHVNLRNRYKELDSITSFRMDITARMQNGYTAK